MSDGIKAWHEDSDDYVRLCKKYGEKIQDNTDLGVRGWPYNSKHHEELQARENSFLPGAGEEADPDGQ